MTRIIDKITGQVLDERDGQPSPYAGTGLADEVPEPDEWVRQWDEALGDVPIAWEAEDAGVPDLSRLEMLALLAEEAPGVRVHAHKFESLYTDATDNPCPASVTARVWYAAGGPAVRYGMDSIDPTAPKSFRELASRIIDEYRRRQTWPGGGDGPPDGPAALPGDGV